MEFRKVCVFYRSLCTATLLPNHGYTICFLVEKRIDKRRRFCLDCPFEVLVPAMAVDSHTVTIVDTVGWSIFLQRDTYVELKN